MDTSNLILMNAALSSLATEAIIGLQNLRLSSKFLFNNDCRVKKWCKACKKSEKEEKKAQFREQERLREEMYADSLTTNHRMTMVTVLRCLSLRL